MKKIITPKKPLTLDTTTLRQLTTDELPKISGGKKSVSVYGPSGG